MTKAFKPGSRTAAIRDYLTRHPDALPKEVAGELAKRNVFATGAAISNVKFLMRHGRDKRTMGTAINSARKGELVRVQLDGPNGNDFRNTVALLVSAKKLILQAGGNRAARKALEAAQLLA